MFFKSSHSTNKDEHRPDLLSEENSLPTLGLVKQIYLFLVGLIGLFAIDLFLSLISFAFPKESREPFVFIGTYFVLIVALIIPLIPEAHRFKKYFKNYQNYLLGVLIGLGILLFDSIYSNIVNLFYDFGINNNESSLRQIAATAPFLTFIVTAFIGPICEELTYRAGLFSLLKRVNIVLAYVVTSLIFGLIHFDFTSPNIVIELINLPIYAFSGFALCLTYNKLGLTGSISAHMFNNIIAISAVLQGLE